MVWMVKEYVQTRRIIGTIKGTRKKKVGKNVCMYVKQNIQIKDKKAR